MTTLTPKPKPTSAVTVPYAVTEAAHIWLHVPTGKYLFSDETENFDDGRYDTIEEAKQALADYATYSLDGKLKDVETMLDKVPLEVRTEPFVVMARTQFAQCRGREAILTLRRFAESLRPHSPALYDLVMNRPA